MKVENIDGKIKVEADYLEMAVIATMLDDYAAKNDDRSVKDLAYQLHNPKIIVSK